MWYFTDLANLWDRSHQRAEKSIGEWVDHSGGDQIVIASAATAHAFMTFGAGFVDLLRLGDGVKQGGWKGWGTDAIRFVAIFPFGRVAGIMRLNRGLPAAKLIADPGGPICFWVASTKALRQMGAKINGRLFATVEDLATALGMTSKFKSIYNISEGLALLKKLGVGTGLTKAVNTVRDVERMLSYNGSVVMIEVRIKRGNSVSGHALYAFRDHLGRVRYMDRAVSPGNTQRVFSSLDELRPWYGADAIVPIRAAALTNINVKYPAYETPRLAVPILGVLASDAPAK